MILQQIRKRRSVTLAALMVWGLWSAMAVCFAELAVEEHGSVPESDGSMSAHLPMADELPTEVATAADGMSGHEMPCHDGSMDETGDVLVSAADCCDQGEMLRVDRSSIDLDFALVMPTTDWLNGIESVGQVLVPDAYPEFLHQSLPRLHLLLSVFLD